jgi:3-hydroxyisobutyrate dehydrogenase
MALNLFSKTWHAHQQASERAHESPNFLICEHDERRAEAFMEDLRQKGGSELAGSVSRVSNGRESVFFAVIR